MNPSAIVFWMLFACIRFLIHGIVGAVVGLAGGLAISLLAGLATR